MNWRFFSFRFNRLVFDFRPSPSILGATIKHYLQLLKQDKPEIAQLFENSFYVDDLIAGAEEDQRAFDIYQKSKEIMSKGGFNLRKWNSNSKTLFQKIASSEFTENQKNAKSVNKMPAEITAEDDESYAKSSTGIGDCTTHDDRILKILGIKWNTFTDEFLFHFKDLYNYGNSLSVNKRSVLKITAKIVDPLRITSPFVI